MSVMVVEGAMLMCPFGMAPCSLRVTSQAMCLGCNKPAATITDAQGQINIQGFGMCTSLANPRVAAATTAALGVLMPQPCSCATAGLWRNSKSMPLVGGKPSLGGEATLLCTNGMGMIIITMPGQIKVLV